MSGEPFGEETAFSVDESDVTDGPVRVYVLVDDDATEGVLVDWLDAHDGYEPVRRPALEDAAFDLCLVDEGALERHAEALRQRKRRADPVLLPSLYVLPEHSSAFFERDTGTATETFDALPVDEVLSLPIQGGELRWRLDSLLEQRAQTRTLRDRDHLIRRLGRAVEAAGHAIYLTDTEGTITYVNPAFEVVTGYSPAEAVGETVRILQSGEMPDEYYESLWETIQSGNIWEEEIINERKDGSLYHALQTIAPVTDEDDDIEGFVAIQTDITDQKSLETRQRQFQQAIESSRDLLAAVDDDSNFLFANETYREYHGLGGREIQGVALEAVVDDEAYAAIEPYLERVLDGETVNFETTRSHPETGVRILDVTYYPLRNEAGDIRGIAASMRDITDKKEHMRRLETLVSNLPGIVYRCHDTPERPMEFVGGRCEAITGYSAAQLEASAVSWGSDVIHPGDRARVRETVAAAVEADEPFELTYRIQTKAGNERWIWEQGLEVTPVADDAPMLEGFLMDVTARKAREAELRQKSRAIDEAPIGIVITDPTQADNPLTYVNEGFVELTGYAREDVIGVNCRFLQGENTDPATTDKMRRAIDAAEPVSVVLRNYRANGTEFWNSLEIAPVRDRTGEVINYIGFQQDVTDRIERQRQLTKFDQVLRHTLHNDLNVVQGRAEQVKRACEPPAQDHAAQIIDKSDSLLDTMDKGREITQLLGEAPTVREVPLLSTLHPLVDSLREEFPAATIRLTGPDQQAVRGTEQLRVALEEVIRNAIVHDDSETATVDVSVIRAPDAETVAVQVADTGPGIPEMEVDILTGNAEETPLYHGRGLGLWLVHLIVRRCGGTIEFGDNAPRGSTVTITLEASER